MTGPIHPQVTKVTLFDVKRSLTRERVQLLVRIPRTIVALSVHFLSVVSMCPSAVCTYPLPSQPLNRRQVQTD